MRKRARFFRWYHLLVALLLVVVGMMLARANAGLGGAFVMAGLMVPSIPLIGDWHASKRNQDN